MGNVLSTAMAGAGYLYCILPLPHQNIALVYVKLGYSRLAPEKQAELLPTLVRALEMKATQQQDSYVMGQQLVCIGYS